MTNKTGNENGPIQVTWRTVSLEPRTLGKVGLSAFVVIAVVIGVYQAARLLSTGLFKETRPITDVAAGNVTGGTDLGLIGTPSPKPTASAAEMPVLSASNIVSTSVNLVTPTALPVRGNRYFVISVTDVATNIYAQPGETSKWIGQFAPHVTLSLLEQSDDLRWLKVTSGDLTGWVLSDAVTLGVHQSPTIASAAPKRVAQPTRVNATVKSPPAVTCNGSKWFFTPHPDRTLINFRVTPISHQSYAGGELYWFLDLGQTWVLFNDGQKTWTNLGGDLATVSAKLATRLGAPVTNAVRYDAFAGHTLDGNKVTAYVTTVDHRILSWMIDTATMQPVSWAAVEAKFVDCR